MNFKMSVIKKLEAKEIFDSRGTPTISVLCELESEASGIGMVPSGKSTGSLEALELRDGDMVRFSGKGVLKAVKNVNVEIAKFLIGKDLNQEALDEALIKIDGTKNKSRLGANAILGVSLAFAHACARDQKINLYEYFGKMAGNEKFKTPQPCFNIINGGRHSNSEIDIQEFMIVPTGFNSVSEKINSAKRVVSELESILKNKNYKTDLGDEGGFAPTLSSNEEALDLIVEAISKAGYTNEIQIGIDAAGTSFYENGKYVFKVGGRKEERNAPEMISWYENIVKKYPIVFIEDPFAEEDWEAFTELTNKLGDKIKIIGDDLTVTNPERISLAIKQKAINAVLIKINQIGTLTETLRAVNLTKAQGWKTMVSHRSGETLDTTIADVGVGFGCEFIKSGAPTRPERTCKYDRLVEIEKQSNNLN